MVRIIPIVTIREQYVVKRTHFNPKSEVYVGDAFNTVKILSDLGADEILLIDITGMTTKESKFSLLEKLAAVSTVPLGYGGGIRTSTVAESIINLGFEKIVINSEFLYNPSLVKECSDLLGSQAVVGSVDYTERQKRINVFDPRIRSVTNIDPINQVILLEQFGCGEVLFTATARENGWRGFDVELARIITACTSIPVIMHGGMGSNEHLHELFSQSECDAGIGSYVMFSDKLGGVAVNYPFKSRNSGEIKLWRN